ncbi:unnamed protein product [Durusdinium trenchii]|uniref:Kinesin-like protein n=1 Tax=Durusdinium trenchii TaxID=1381693 RepID=A0ABP0J5M9_9DINO
MDMVGSSDFHVQDNELESHIVDAPRNVKARAEQEAKWAGDYDGRQHWSLREAYLKHRARLQGAQRDLYRVKLLLDAHFLSQSSCLKDLDLSILERVADFGFAQGPAVGFLAGWRKPKPTSNPHIRFMARKRPLLPFEVAAGDWDCVTISRSAARVVCHDGRLHRTGRRLEMLHKKFVLDQAYDSSVSDSEFYADAVRPLVASLTGAEATIICYGQTGTGKTHTFNACWKRIGNDLAGCTISVTFFEIHGKKCYDLLQQRKEVTLRADGDERVHVRGATTLTAAATDVASLLEEALLLRRSESTEGNPLSSRSHAVCVLSIEGGGSIRFVDLAGSERNYETRFMTAQQHRDFAEINKWIRTVNNGLFKYLVLPPKITGEMLLHLSSQALSELFDMSLRAARGVGEGEAWNEALAKDVGIRVGRMLFAAVRKEAMRWPSTDNWLICRREERELEESLGLPPESERHCEFFFWGETVPRNRTDGPD